MNKQGIATRNNQPVEIFRLIASILVLFVHFPFPGAIGRGINCLARCAVPGFFAISGFFSYGASAGKLGKRLRALGKLTLLAFGLELLWNCLLIELDGGSSIGYLRAMIPNARETAEFLLLNINPLRDTLWYLPAALEAMAVLWIYVRFFGEEPVDYRPLYLVGVCLFACNLVMGTMSLGAGQEVSIFLYRNGLFFGVPLLAMGVFLGQHWQRIIRNFALTDRKLVLLVLGCLAMSFVEWYGFGICDVMVGSVTAVLFLMLLMAKNPVICTRPGVGTCIGIFGALSSGVYVLHSIAGDFYTRFCQPVLADFGAEPWLRPFLVLAITLVWALVWERITFITRRNKRKKEKRGTTSPL